MSKILYVIANIVFSQRKQNTSYEVKQFQFHLASESCHMNANT